MLDGSAGMERMLQLTVVICLAVHTFACLFYLTAKLRDFGPDTWVYNVGILDASPFDSWLKAIYWAFQT